jgi:hypothetical protein
MLRALQPGFCMECSDETQKKWRDMPSGAGSSVEPERGETSKAGWQNFQDHGEPNLLATCEHWPFICCCLKFLTNCHYFLT